MLKRRQHSRRCVLKSASTSQIPAHTWRRPACRWRHAAVATTALEQLFAVEVHIPREDAPPEVGPRTGDGRLPSQLWCQTAAARPAAPQGAVRPALPLLLLPLHRLRPPPLHLQGDNTQTPEADTSGQTCISTCRSWFLCAHLSPPMRCRRLWSASGRASDDSLAGIAPSAAAVLSGAIASSSSEVAVAKATCKGRQRALSVPLGLIAAAAPRTCALLYPCCSAAVQCEAAAAGIGRSNESSALPALAGSGTGLAPPLAGPQRMQTRRRRLPRLPAGWCRHRH